MIHGNYFFAHHSHGYLATMTMADQQLIISHDTWDAEQIHDLTTARLSPPVGKTPLTILFANGDSFETPYDKSLIALFTASRPSHPLFINTFTHLLESRGKLIALLLTATISLLPWHSHGSCIFRSQSASANSHTN